MIGADNYAPCPLTRRKSPRTDPDRSLNEVLLCHVPGIIVDDNKAEDRADPLQDFFQVFQVAIIGLHPCDAGMNRKSTRRTILVSGEVSLCQAG